MTRRPNVLVIAEAANPEWVSVPLIGWSLSRALAGVANVHLVTQIRNRDAILRAGLVEGQDFTAIDSEAFARPLWAIGEKIRGGGGKGWTTLQLINALSYPHFERLVWRRFGADIRAGRYDIVHRVTPLSPTISSPLAAKCARAGVPFVLGPLNGGVPWPREFDAERRQEKEWLSYVRGVYKALPGRRRSLKHAAAIIAGSRHTEGEIPAAMRDKTFYIPENAIDPARFAKRAQPGGDGPLRACFIGRMVPYKGPDMLLEAAGPLLREGRMRLYMVGDGPMLPGLKAQAEALGVTGAVTFHGWMEHGAVQDVLAASDLMAFPSIREFGGGVVLEAMALGVPSLIVDYAGPAELLTSGSGWKVPLGDRATIVAGFAAQLSRLEQDRSALARAGQMGLDRVESMFTWGRKADQISGIYNWILGECDDRPKPMSDRQDHAAE